LAVAASALDPLARPSLVQAALLPVLFFGSGLLIGRAVAAREVGSPRRIPLLDRVPPLARELVSMSFRGGAAVVALLLAVASVLTAGAIFVSYASIITLYENL